MIVAVDMEDISWFGPTRSKMMCICTIHRLMSTFSIGYLDKTHPKENKRNNMHFIVQQLFFLYLNICYKHDENALWIMWDDIIWGDNINNDYSHETLINSWGILPQNDDTILHVMLTLVHSHITLSIEQYEK